MAIDTADKRRSAYVGLGFYNVAAVPDGNQDTEDRAQQRWCYRGLTYAEAVLPPPVVIIGGDDAPRRTRRKRRKEQHDLFRELEKTVHGLLHPPAEILREEPVEPVAAREAGRALDELVVLAQGQHALLQRAAALRAELRSFEIAQQAIEQDEEDALIWMF